LVNCPERGLFTGIAIFGAIGTGKTSGYILQSPQGKPLNLDALADW